MTIEASERMLAVAGEVAIVRMRDDDEKGDVPSLRQPRRGERV